MTPLLSALLVSSAVVGIQTPAPTPVPMTGGWTIAGDVQGVAVSEVCTLVQAESKLTGSCKGQDKTWETAGSTDGRKVSFHHGAEYEGQALVLTYSGVLGEDGTLKGSIDVDPLNVSGSFTATRVAAPAPSSGAALFPAQASTAMTADPPADAANPTANVTFQIPSHGAKLNALMLVAPGAGPHPVVVLLHGFPGNEKNLDLAQTMRRAGWNVLYFDYRGSWGTPGDFCFGHSMEDAQAAVAWVRDPANAGKTRSNRARVVLIGHSMGGMIATWVAAHDPAIEAVSLISAADMAGRTRLPPHTSGDDRKKVLAMVAAGLAAEGMAPLAGCTPESLAAELMAHAQEWALLSSATALVPRPVQIITSDDGLAPAADALAAAIQASGDEQVTQTHIATDHSYTGKRIELAQTVLNALETLPK